MARVRVAEAASAALDWMVATAEGYVVSKLSDEVEVPEVLL